MYSSFAYRAKNNAPNFCHRYHQKMVISVAMFTTLFLQSTTDYLGGEVEWEGRKGMVGEKDGIM